eukprot:gene10906-2980_t
MMVKTAVAIFALAVVAFGDDGSSAVDGCTSRNKDYCAVADECTWDSLQSVCRKYGCQDYPDHSYCTADPQRVGPCSYAWVQRTCYDTNSPIPCLSYLEDCPTDRCQYDEDNGFCFPNGEQIPCFTFFDPDDCKKQAPRCTLLDSLCISSEEANACSMAMEQSKCTGSCHWYNELHLCFPKDLAIPCKYFPTNDTCDTSRCQFYNKDTGDVICVEKGTQPPCP